MTANIPRLVIAGLSGDSGKTLISLSLLAACRRRALAVAVFKKGPDYIDAAWLSQFAGRPCRNLDTFMTAPHRVLSRFMASSTEADLALIEGNRGLFDGRDASGTHSTSSLSRLLDAPTILVIDCHKATRTIAALVKGCQVFEPGLNISGVILNQVAGKRHENVIREAIENQCQVPVLGVIPKIKDGLSLLPNRHLGLVPPTEHGEITPLEKYLADLGEKYLDINKLLEISRASRPLEFERPGLPAPKTGKVRIGYFRDEVFTFYYPENLEALAARGANLIPVNSLTDTLPSDLDALYIGGGFPEVFAARLCKNRMLMQAVRNACEKGMPVYAECGGLIYLAASLEWEGIRYPMSGVFPVDLMMQRKPVGHGYVEAVVEKASPYFAPGTIIRGHEFHYSGVLRFAEGCFVLKSGVGFGQGQDGLIYKNTLATYMHIHADGCPEWAGNFCDAAETYRGYREKKVLAKSARAEAA